MKFSEAMLKGYMTNGGKQTVGEWGTAGEPMCVMGAAMAGAPGEEVYEDAVRFIDVWGVSPQTLNDAGVHWMELYGMAVAAGL